MGSQFDHGEIEEKILPERSPEDAAPLTVDDDDVCPADLIVETGEPGRGPPVLKKVRQTLFRPVGDKTLRANHLSRVQAEIEESGFFPDAGEQVSYFSRKERSKVFVILDHRGGAGAIDHVAYRKFTGEEVVQGNRLASPAPVRRASLIAYEEDFRKDIVQLFTLIPQSVVLNDESEAESSLNIIRDGLMLEIRT